MINFKKVVSMAVVLSLMLGACGKNPARRDDEMTKADALTQKTGGGGGGTGDENLKGTLSECWDEVDAWGGKKVKNDGYLKFFKNLFYPADGFNFTRAAIPSFLALAALAITDCFLISKIPKANIRWRWARWAARFAAYGTAYRWIVDAQVIAEQSIKDKEGWLGSSLKGFFKGGATALG